MLCSISLSLKRLILIYWFHKIIVLVFLKIRLKSFLMRKSFDFLHKKIQPYEMGSSGQLFMRTNLLKWEKWKNCWIFFYEATQKSKNSHMNNTTFLWNKTISRPSTGYKILVCSIFDGGIRLFGFSKFFFASSDFQFCYSLQLFWNNVQK